MLQRKLFATLLATALLLSAALPAFAAPAQDEVEAPSVVSVVISWLSKTIGLAVVTEPEAKLGSVVDPMGLDGSSGPDDDSSPTTLTTTSDDNDELGSAWVPGG